MGFVAVFNKNAHPGFGGLFQISVEPGCSILHYSASSMSPSKDKDPTWVQLIRAITSPFSAIVLILLIIGELFFTVPNSSLQTETKSPVMWFALCLFAFVILNVVVMFWIDKMRPGPLAIHHEEMRDETTDHTDNVLVASPAASTTEAVLRAFWKPDGKHINKTNEKRLKAWMKEKGFGRLPISFFLVDVDLEMARVRAIQDLEIPMQLSAKG